MTTEIERRFLFDKLPDMAPVITYEIEQAYLNRKPVLRIRRKTSAEKTSCEFTFKGKKTGAIGKEEMNLPLNEDAYEHLKEKADGIILHKTRYVYDLGGALKAEADVFHAPYEDLRIVEVEFTSEEAAASFVPPAWFGEEITGVKGYSNASLAYDAQL